MEYKKYKFTVLRLTKNEEFHRIQYSDFAREISYCIKTAASTECTFLLECDGSLLLYL